VSKAITYYAVGYTGSDGPAGADDNSRMLFENADEYAQLYADEERTPAQFCAERTSAAMT
jgi:hypothetical protein